MALLVTLVISVKWLDVEVRSRGMGTEEAFVCPDDLMCTSAVNNLGHKRKLVRCGFTHIIS
jgi:hypothetical protein